MAQNSFDQLSKQYLEEFLAPIGTVQRQYEIPGEAKFADLWFAPNPEAAQATDLGLLGANCAEALPARTLSQCPNPN